MTNGLVVGICKKCHTIRIIDNFSQKHLCEDCKEVLTQTDLSYSDYIKLDMSPDELREHLIRKYLTNQTQI